MICPFCGKEMKRGIMSGDGRSRVFWKAGNSGLHTLLLKAKERKVQGEKENQQEEIQ